MRVALVNDLIYPYAKGGVEKRVADVAGRLARRGHDVHLIGTKQWDGPATISHGDVVVEGVASPSATHTGRGRRSIWQAVACAVAVGRHMLRRRYDVIDVQSMAPLTCLTVLAIAKARGTPCVVTWHEVWGDYWLRYLGWLGRVGMGVERAIARWGDSHVAVSGHTLRRLVMLGTENPLLLPNGIDRTAADRAPEVDTGGAEIICVSRLVNHKNIELLIDAVALMGEGSGSRLIVIGDGPERLRLKERAESLQADVEFMTGVDEHRRLYGLLKGSRVFVLPSLREGFGLAVLEAAACGLPTIVVDHPDNAATELVHPDLVVDPDPEALAASIRSLLDDEELWSKYSQHSQDTAGVFDLDRMASELESVYRVVVRSGRPIRPR